MLAKLLTAVLLLSLTATARAEADPPALTPDPPRLEQRVTALEQRVAELERLLQAKAAPAPAYTAPAPAARAAMGHTHTCANGHTWDHGVTSGHTCPVAGCGLSQYCQDTCPRAVTTAGATYQPYQPAARSSYQPSYTLSSGGCANGSCSSGYESGARFQPFGGVFRRR
jgi:hypothetical protein